MTIDERIEAITMNLELAMKEIEALQVLANKTARIFALWRVSRRFVSAV